MTTLAHTESTPRVPSLRAHLGTYLAGAGATTALTAGVLAVFLSLATFVAFKGLPFGGSSDDPGLAYIGARVHPPRIHTPDAQKALYSLMKSPDGL